MERHSLSKWRVAEPQAPSKESGCSPFQARSGEAQKGIIRGLVGRLQLKEGCREMAAVAMKGASGTPHTVVMTLRDPERKRMIFFFSAWEALIFTKTLG